MRMESYDLYERRSKETPEVGMKYIALAYISLGVFCLVIAYFALAPYYL